MASLKKLLNLAEENLDPDEEILAYVFGAYKLGKGLRNGLLAATNKRVVLCTGGVWFNRSFEFFPYDSISSVGYDREVGGVHKVCFFAFGNETSVQSVLKQEDVNSFVAAVQSHTRGGNSTSYTTPSPSGFDPVEEIRRYAALRDEGIITEEEFQEKKRKLLS